MSDDKPELFSDEEPLPDISGSNQILLIAQSPSRLYFFWCYDGDLFETLRRACPEQADDYRLVVKLLVADGREVETCVTASGNNHWFDVSPGLIYKAIIGFFSERHPFISLMASKPVRTPRPRVSDLTDPTSEFSVSTRDFARVLAASGALRDAFFCVLEAADQEEQVRSGVAGSKTRELAEQFGGVEAPPLKTEEDLRAMRGLLADLAFAKPEHELFPQLDAPFAGWLALAFIRQRYSKPQNYAHGAARLSGLLRQLLWEGGSELTTPADLQAGFSGNLSFRARQHRPVKRARRPGRRQPALS